MSSSSDEELILFALLRAQKRKRIWVHEINKKRNELGEYHRLCQELISDEDRFFSYFRMSQNSFEDLHELLRPKIEKKLTNWRKPISTKERLAICLRYLATGDSYQTISFSYRIGRSTVGSIVKQVCREIWNTLQPIYMPKPTEETWKAAEIGFRQLWNFPNCVGSIDGKHVAVKCPPNSGSNYFCYKNFFSVVLLAVVDPFYKFIVVDIGSYGRQSDNGIFENSKFFQEYLDGKTLLPSKPLPGTSNPVPHVLIGDEGFGLQTYLMRPFPKTISVIDERKKTFNKRLCRARRVVENTFGILAQKWRIFLRPIESEVETAVHVVEAACVLHNYIKTKQGTITITENENQNEPIQALTTHRPTNRRPTAAAFQIREAFVSYFNNNTS